MSSIKSKPLGKNMRKEMYHDTSATAFPATNNLKLRDILDWMWFFHFN